MWKFKNVKLIHSKDIAWNVHVQFLFSISTIMFHVKLCKQDMRFFFNSNIHNGLETVTLF